MQPDRALIKNIKHAGKILNRAELKIFTPITVWPELAKGIKNKVFISVNRPPLVTQDVDINTDLSFNMDGVGFIHYLYTDQLQFGYAVEITSKKSVECRGSYINTVINKNKKGYDPAHVMNVNGFSVYKMDGDFLIAQTSMNLINHLL